MPFSPPRSIPGLKADSARTLLAALNSIGIDLRLALSSGLSVTPVVTIGGLAQFNQLILCAPPAAGMDVLLPKGTLSNKGGRIQIGILTVAGGGAVRLAVTGGEQTVDGLATKTLSAVGLVELACTGPNGWLSMGASGGSGGVSDGVYGSITVTGGGTIWQVTDGVYGDVTVSGGGTIWTVAAGGGSATDATVTLAFSGKRSDVVNVVDASVTALTKLVIGWGTVLASDANNPEDNPVTFTAEPAAGSFSLRISSANPLVPVGGAYKIRYIELT